MRSRVASKINSPKVRRGLDKFEGDEIVAVVVMDEASHATNGVFVRLQVGDNELLESDDVGREADQSSRPADILGGGWFGKRRMC